MKLKYLILTAVIAAVCAVMGADKSNHLAVGMTAAVIAVGSATINVLWLRGFLKEIQSLSKILTDEKNPDKYISEMEKRLEEKKSAALRSMLITNIAIGYCEKRDYKAAKEKLMEVRNKGLEKRAGLNYYMILAYVHFYLKEYGEGHEVMESYGERFKTLKSSEGPMIAVLAVFDQIAQGNTEKANELLFAAELKYADAESDLKYLKNLLNKPSKEP